ncbi:hypothetical protein AX16_002563 [Volvariella volvacea WC 439]|nr:hypothetical protein AX16_002563 [Volvariella volvacea WC 439]
MATSSTWIVLGCLCLASLAIVKICHRLYGHQLSHIPGPRLAALTDLYWIYYDLVRDGERIEALKRLHEKYGSVVRIGPNELHFNDPRAFEDIYVRNGHKFPKEAAFYNAFLEQESSFGYLNAREAKARKDVLRPLFSRQAISKLESVIQSTVDKLISSLTNYIPEKHEEKPMPADLTLGYLCTSMDIITSYCFARSFNTLAYSPTSFAAPIITFLESAGSMYCWFQHFPSTIPLAQKAIFENGGGDGGWMRLRSKWSSGVAMKLGAAMFHGLRRILGVRVAAKAHGSDEVEGRGIDERNSVEATKELYRVLEAQIDAILQDPDSLDLAEHAIIYHRLVKKGDSKSGQDVSAPSKRSLLNEAGVMFAAGSESVKNASLNATFHVLNNERILRRLKAELKGNWKDVNEGMGWEKLEKLPYLTAVIKESLRSSPGVVSPLPRVVTETTTIGSTSTIVPAGTIVSMGIPIMHATPRIFPNPNKFIPERWIEGEPLDAFFYGEGDLGAEVEKLRRSNTKEQIREREAHLVAFSKGPRGCLGINLAWCELYLILGNVFRKLDLETYQTTADDLRYRAYLTPAYRGHVKVLVRGIED